MMMRRSPFSSPSSIESVKSHTNRDDALDPNIFNSSAAIEPSTPAADIDLNMEGGASGLDDMAEGSNN